MAEAEPSTPSSAYKRMADIWHTIDDILAGPEAIRKAGIRYLPQYGSEEGPEYTRRLSQAPWQAEFDDALSTLASKPFSKEIAVTAGSTPQLDALIDDIDGKGNNLTAFARPMFRKAVAKGMHAILVDNTGRGRAKTIAQERAAGVRPYWVSIRAEDILALYTAFVAGKEVPIHVRLLEGTTERNGFEEVTKERVRVLDRAPQNDAAGNLTYGPPTWELYEKQLREDGEVEWVSIDSGVFSPLTEIPLAIEWTGEREGSQFVRPPLAALADKQIELYRALSRQDEILTYAGSPMLCGQGIAPPKKGDPPLEVGPKRILFAPPGVEGKITGWAYIQPDAANLKEIRESVSDLVDDIRRLGMQPLTQKSGGVTATASSLEGAKAHSAVQAWALGLQDVLEQAFVFTSQWLGQDANVELEVDTDFSVEPYAQAPLDALTKARKNGDISRPTYWQGLRRFDVLSPDFDPEAEEEALAEEAQGVDEFDPAIDPATGLPIVTPPNEQALNA